MHGLRCTPSLLGWTRLLDEWVVGLVRYNRESLSDPVCWQDRARTLDTLADAATRARSFAYRESDVSPTVPGPDGMLRFELQGLPYVVACRQQWIETPAALRASGSAWLEEALQTASQAAERSDVPVGLLFVTPRLSPGLSAAERLELAEELVSQSRCLPASACAFSFPDPGETDRYRYANAEYPGGMLLVKTA
jgi:hypothetical protein